MQEPTFQNGVRIYKDNKNVCSGYKLGEGQTQDHRGRKEYLLNVQEQNEQENHISNKHCSEVRGQQLKGMVRGEVS